MRYQNIKCVLGLFLHRRTNVRHIEKKKLVITVQLYVWLSLFYFTHPFARTHIHDSWNTSFKSTITFWYSFWCNLGTKPNQCMMYLPIFIYVEDGLSFGTWEKRMWIIQWTELKSIYIYNYVLLDVKWIEIILVIMIYDK